MFTGGQVQVGLGQPVPIIDNGPLSDTQATLNSIYHPIDPSQFIINNFAPGLPTPDLNMMDPCTIGLCGVQTTFFRPSEPEGDARHPGRDGVFQGRRLNFRYPTGIVPVGDTFTVENDVHARRSDPDAPGHIPGIGDAAAWMDPRNPYFNHTMAGQDSYDTVKDQIIELGNSLTKITNKMTDQEMQIAQQTAGPGHERAQESLENRAWCLLTAIVAVRPLLHNPIFAQF